jgi:type VI secretion system protein ImpK
VTPQQAGRQPDNLALVFQETLTAIERIRAVRERVADAESFRAEIRQQFIATNEEGRKRGYSREDIRLAMFAVIAFLDESILNSRNPVFADWPRRPLQQEIFGGHQAGEVFFQNVEGLLAQPDSSVLADVLEVYLLCVLLGYGGRYSVVGKGELRAVADSMAERIRRIRGASDLSPGWAPQGGVPAATQGDPWVKRLAIAAGACLAVALLLFVTFKIVLSSGVTGLQ